MYAHARSKGTRDRLFPHSREVGEKDVIVWPGYGRQQTDTQLPHKTRHEMDMSARTTPNYTWLLFRPCVCVRACVGSSPGKVCTQMTARYSLRVVNYLGEMEIQVSVKVGGRCCPAPASSPPARLLSCGLVSSPLVRAVKSVCYSAGAKSENCPGERRLCIRSQMFGRAGRRC
jgi:hypothetical protein